MEFNSTNADKFISTTHYDGAAVERLNKCFEYAATQRWKTYSSGAWGTVLLYST